MNRILGLILLCMSQFASAETPNLFEPREASTQEILKFMVSCSADLQKADARFRESYRFTYCACVADAWRLRRKTKDKEPTRADLQRCAQETARTVAPFEDSESPLTESPAENAPEQQSVEEAAPSSSVESDPEPTRSCCKVCTRGCPCGDSCISCSKVCRKGPGCAC